MSSHRSFEQLDVWIDSLGQSFITSIHSSMFPPSSFSPMEVQSQPFLFSRQYELTFGCDLKRKQRNNDRRKFLKTAV